MKVQEGKATQFIAIFLLIFSLLLYLVIIPDQVSDTRTFGVSPRVMPDVIALVLVFLSVCLFFSGRATAKKANQKVYTFEPAAMKLVLLAVAVLIVYQLVVYTVGFIITAALFVAVLMFATGQRSKVTIGAISVILPVSIYMFFNKILQMYLP